MFKCSNNILNVLPNVISNLYIKNNEIHSYFTRNSNLLRIPKDTPNFTLLVHDYGMKLSLKLL